MFLFQKVKILMKKRKIMLVTMATPISSHVKDKNSIFTARNEDMIFWKKEKSWYFISIYIITVYTISYTKPCIFDLSF